MNSETNHPSRRRLTTWLIIPLILLFASCSYMPFTKKKTDTPTTTDQPQKGQAQATKVEGMEKIEDIQAKPGDVKVIDGVDYIFARNKRYMLTPQEPEYVWIRKDQYSPGLGENLLSGMGKKEREEMEKRIAKLEEDAKKRGLNPQAVYPAQMMYLPPGMGYLSMAPMMINFNYPSPKMKRKVVVLPFADQTNYRDEQMGDLAMRRLISRLENTGTVISVELSTLNLPQPLTSQSNLKVLNELYGVQALIKGTLSDVYTTTSKIDGKDDRETSFAMSRIALDIYNTETASVQKQIVGRNPVSLSRERGDMSTEKAKMKAIDLTIEVIGEDLLKAILSIDWHARIASIEEGKIYISAGRLSNLAKGDILEVYAPGVEKIDSQTNASLGKVKGAYKGEIEVVELFGVDACWSKVKKGTAFSPTDLVFLKKQ
jgi:hypothetical protein